jgi:hypothetical protein
MCEEYNKMELQDKLKLYIDHNSCMKDFEWSYTEGSLFYLIIHFKISQFTSNLIKYMFSYWGLNWQDWVFEWRVEPYSYKNVKITMWIRKSISREDCKKHELKKVVGWGNTICCKCGLFSNLPEEEIIKKLLEIPEI